MMHQSGVTDDHGWCRAFLAVLPVEQATVCTLGDPFEPAVLAASDAAAAVRTQLEIDRGVGLCWQAKATREPVLVPRLAAPPAWGMLAPPVDGRYPTGSAYALPMAVGNLLIGAVSLYSATDDALSDADIAAAREPLARVSLDVLHDAVQSRDDPDASAAAGRRVVHQATGMVMAQTRLSAHDALLLLRGRAFADGQTVHDIAVAIVDRMITFTS